VGDLARGMHTGIGAASTLNDMVAGLQVREGGLDGGLHGGLATVLALPAIEGATVVVDFQGIARHMQALAYGCAPCNAKGLAKGCGGGHAGKNHGGVMRRLIIALCLMAGPGLAQDDTLLPPDGGLGDVFDYDVDDAVDGVDDTMFAVGAEFVATISTVLKDDKAQSIAVDLAMTRLKVPAPLQAVMKKHLGALLAENVVQNDIAEELAFAFYGMGMTPSNPDVIARLAGEQLLVWGDEWLFAGLSRLSAADQAAGLALHLRLAQAAPAQDCADYLSDVQDYGQTRRMQTQIMATWPAAEAKAALALMRRAILAETSAAEAAPDLTFPEISRAEQAAGLAILAAVDATDDPGRLFAAFGYAEQATAEDICAARVTMLQAVQGMTGPDAALAMRYVMHYGLND
jgi:hypothetical protein